MNIWRRIIFILSLCTIIVPEYICAHHLVQAEEERAEVETELKQGKHDYIQYQLNIPIFDDMKSERFAKKLNTYYKTSILAFKKKLEKEAKQYYEEAQKKELTFHPYIASVDYTVTYNSPSLLSLYVNYYQYTGGAHGIYRWDAHTYDVQRKQELKLSHLFKKESAYIKMIRNEIVRQMKQDAGKFFPDATEQVQQQTDFSFFLQKDGIVVYYSLYSIAPYAAGIPQFTIPYALLKTDLQPDYAKILIDNSYSYRYDYVNH